MPITSDDIVGGKIKINGTEYSLVQIVHGGTGRVIWPLSQPTYVIDTSTLALHYTSSASWILASGSNYCYATANINVMRGSTVISTITNATLTPTGISGTYSPAFFISGGNIYGYDLLTTPVNTGTSQSPQGYYCTASFVYTPEGGSATAAVTTTVYQQYNLKTETSHTDQRTDLDPLVEERNASVSIGATNYTSSSSSCPASGGNCRIEYSAYVERQTTPRWVIETTTYYSFTSGHTSSEVTTEEYSGTPSGFIRTSVDPDITGGASWATNYNDTITIENRGTNNNDQVSGGARSVTYTAAYDDGLLSATDSVTIYQQANTKQEIIEPIRSIEITTQGAIPASGGTFNVSYASQESYGSYIYTSGDTSGTPSTRSRTGEISCTNCSYNGSTSFNVSGTGTITLTVPANTSSSSRYATVSLDGYESDSIEQYEVCTFGLLWGTTNIYNGYEFVWSRPRDILSRIALTDSGSNHRFYSFSKSSGNVANIDYNIMSQTIEVTGITAGMDDWFQVSEASSGQSIKFYIKTNIL